MEVHSKFGDCSALARCSLNAVIRPPCIRKVTCTHLGCPHRHDEIIIASVAEGCVSVRVGLKAMRLEVGVGDCDA
jgi:hypothetical protein